MPRAHYPAQDPVVEALIKQRRLSSRDANLARGVQMTPTETAADTQGDYTAPNIRALAQEIVTTQDPKARAILLEEFTRIKGAMSNFVGPIPQQEESLRHPMLNIPTPPMPPANRIYKEPYPPINGAFVPNRKPALIYTPPIGGLGWRRG